MRSFNIVQIFGLLILLSSCFDTGENAARKREEKKMQLEMDHSQCVSYGFPPGSMEYANCRMKLDQQRIEFENQEKLQQQNTTTNLQPSLSTKNPNKICNQKYCY